MLIRMTRWSSSIEAPKRPPHRTLGKWRTNRPAQPDHPLRLPPPAGPQRRMTNQRQPQRGGRLDDQMGNQIRTSPPVPRNRKRQENPRQSHTHRTATPTNRLGADPHHTDPDCSSSSSPPSRVSGRLVCNRQLPQEAGASISTIETVRERSPSVREPLAMKRTGLQAKASRICGSSTKPSTRPRMASRSRPNPGM